MPASEEGGGGVYGRERAWRSALTKSSFTFAGWLLVPGAASADDAAGGGASPSPHSSRRSQSGGAAASAAAAVNACARKQAPQARRVTSVSTALQHCSLSHSDTR